MQDTKTTDSVTDALGLPREDSELKGIKFPTEGTHNGIRLRVWAWDKSDGSKENTYGYELSGVHAWAYRDFFGGHWVVRLEYAAVEIPPDFTIPGTDLYFFMGDLCRPGTDIQLELTAREALHVLKTIDDILGGAK